MSRRIPVIFLLLAFFFVCADESPVIQKVDDGHINWTDGTIVVNGSGVPDLNVTNGNSARLFSEKVAVRNAGYRLQKILGKISLDGRKTVAEFLKEKKDTIFEIPGSRSAPMKKMDKKIYSDGAVDMKLVYSIKDSLHEVCSRYREELQKVSVSTKVIRNLPVDENVLFSKLVVEVTKKKFVKALFPRIVCDGGKLIYGIEKQTAKDQCGKLMMYVDDHSKDDCLYIKAVKINKKGEIVLSEEDDLKIKTQLKDNVLKNGEVVIVLK